MKNHSFSIIQNSKWWFILSAVLLIPGIISLLTWGLNIGIDFKGGTLQQLEFSETRPTTESIRESVGKVNTESYSVQTAGEKGVLIRFASTGSEARTQGDKIIKSVGEKEKVSEKSFQSIGGSVAESTTRKAVWAIGITSLAIILFIALSFGSVPKPASSWRFGISAIIALLHDLLFMIGMYSIIGHFFPNIEVDALFITAVLTILGFSVNDTIIVFDRLRENLKRFPGKSFTELANESLNQTLVRSINTSATVLIVLTSLLILGGQSITNFILALSLGVAIGTYSSIFNATPVLVAWHNFTEIKKK